MSSLPEISIRDMKEADRGAVKAMMETFYRSSAVFTNGSKEIFTADIDACLDPEDPFLSGYVITAGEETAGYCMIARSFSTEFGKHCVWVEDIYLLPAFRGLGIVKKMLDKIREENPGCVLRLETEKENEHAVAAYRQYGFSDLPYAQMVYNKK